MEKLYVINPAGNRLILCTFAELAQHAREYIGHNCQSKFTSSEAIEVLTKMDVRVFEQVGGVK